MGSTLFLLTTLQIVPDAKQGLTRRLNDRYDLDSFIAAEVGQD